MRSQWDCQQSEPTKWACPEWERVWQSVLRRLTGMPPVLSSSPQIEKSLRTMDDAFMQGDSKRFEVALIVLLDHCAEFVNRGDSEQWW